MLRGWRYSTSRPTRWAKKISAPFAHRLKERLKLKGCPKNFSGGLNGPRARREAVGLTFEFAPLPTARQRLWKIFQTPSLFSAARSSCADPDNYRRGHRSGDVLFALTP